MQSERTVTGKGRLWTAAFIVIVCCSLFSFLMGQSANSGTSVYLDHMGEAAGLAGIGAIVFSFAAAFGRIATGPAVDSIGRSVFMIAGAIIMLIGSGGPLFDEGNSLFILWRALQGIGFSICTTACATAAADVLPLDRLGEGIGYYGLGQAISMTVGPALAIFLISSEFPQSFYIGLAFFSVCALICACLCRYERHPLTLPPDSEYRIRFERGRASDRFEDEKGLPAGIQPASVSSCIPDDAAMQDPSLSSEDSELPPKEIWRIIDSVFEPKALAGAIPMMFISVAYGFGIFFIGVFGTSIGVEFPGAFFTLAAITMIAVRLTSGKFMDRIPPLAIMAIAVACALIVYAMLLVCQINASMGYSEYIFYLAGLFYGVSIGVAIPVNQTVSVRVSPPDRWGAANGLFLLANDVAIGIASLICGMTLEAFGYAPTFIGIMICVGLSFLIAVKAYPPYKV